MTDTRGYIHQNKTDRIRVLGEVDVDELSERVAALPPEYWDDHDAQKPNRFGVFGRTQHIVLKFVESLPCPVNYYELPGWAEGHNLVGPILDKVRSYYGYPYAEYPRVMFAKVVAGGTIGIHADGGRFPSFCHKIHVPLMTNPGAEFFIEPKWHHFECGTAVEVNNNARHMVRNTGDTDRIHLIFELFRSPVILEEHDLVFRPPSECPG